MYLYLFVLFGAVFPYKNGHLDGVWAVICGVSICNSSYCPHHVVEFVLRCGSGGVESCLRGVTSGVWIWYVLYVFGWFGVESSGFL